jgi:hypothetical protein
MEVMNHMKHLLQGFLLMGACITASLQAHIFEFANHTNEELKIKIHLEGDASWKWYEAVIAPKTEGHEKSQYNFKFGADLGYKIDEAEWWKGLNCLREAQIQTPLMESKETIDADGNLKVTWIRAVEKDNSGKPLLDKSGKTIPMWNPWRNLEIFFVKDEAYSQVVSAGAMLADGLGEAAAAVASAATGTPMPALKISGIVKGAATAYAYGKCKVTNHFDLIPTADYPREKAVFNVIAITIAR